MNEQDAMFLTILRVGFVILVPIGFYHRLKSRTDEPLDRRQEGLFILVALRLVGLTGIGGLIAYLISPTSMSWSSMSLPVLLRWFGVALGVGSGLLLTWTLKTLGKNLTDTVVTRRDHTLVTNGPYRCVRHPFYVSGFLAIAANGLAGANWFFLVAGALFFIPDFYPDQKRGRTAGSAIRATVSGVYERNGEVLSERGTRKEKSIVDSQ
jgi:protein-S-isoprenylcysteine O-methyltransferase Ste14